MKTDVSVFGRSVVLNIWDFHLQDGFNIRYSDKMRDTVVAIICFGIDSGSSLLTAEHKWADEVKEYTTAPIILVGCKSDTRQALEGIQGRKKVVSTEEGKALAERIGAEIYLECSAVTGEGIDEVFYHAARLSLRPAPKLKTKESKDGCVVF
ncbi:GTP-binding protein Rho1 [Serendipita sp. 411]|nr:GTP-binding protein Rho1 [Serendipita sp. 401]KAG8856839.1 GTP-binding protein Rho1 [Serendipita sp. 411]